ncbi:hypothetical protein BH09PSE5_BH09PSE5_46130 [soil metagenome]
MFQIIQIHVEAPAKPLVGQACNGCGVCCASEPCPVGALFSGRSSGACAALEWREDVGMYRCGLIEHPEAHLVRGLRWTAPTVSRLAKRYISAGSGCDCSQVVEADHMEADALLAN